MGAFVPTGKEVEVSLWEGGRDNFMGGEVEITLWEGGRAIFIGRR